MGRTVPTYRDALNERLARWEREFGRTLTDPADRAAFRALAAAARRYIPQGTMMTSGDLVERVLLSLLLDRFRPPAGAPAEAPDPARSDGEIERPRPARPR